MSLSLINAAQAATSAPTAHQQSPASLFIVVIVMIVFFYFIILRPQNKRMKEQRNLLASLNKGDEVVTTSGIYGKIVRLSDDVAVLAIAEQAEIKIQKSAITAVLPKGSIKAL